VRERKSERGREKERAREPAKEVTGRKSYRERTRTEREHTGRTRGGDRG